MWESALSFPCFTKNKKIHIHKLTQNMYSSLSRRYEETEGFYIPMLLGPFAFSASLSCCVGMGWSETEISPFLQKLNSPYIFQSNLVLQPPSRARVRSTMNDLFQVPPLTSTKEQFWTLSFFYHHLVKGME
jgi:hypothetical protein